LEKDFLLACRKGEDPAKIEAIESQLPEEAVHLKGKVLRSLAIRGGERSLHFAILALRNQLELMRIFVEEEEIAEHSLLKCLEPLHEVFAKIKHVDGNDYCYLLYALHTNYAGHSEIQIELSKMMIQAGVKQGVLTTRNIGYNLLGTGYIEKKEFVAARETLMAYGELLLNEGAPASDFKFVLDPLIKLGKASPGGANFEAFMEMKAKMYESLRIISWKMKSEIPAILEEKSLQSQSESTQDDSDLSTEQALEKTRHLLELVCRIAIADGELDDAEVHDLSETALACCAHLNLPASASQRILDEMLDWLGTWRQALEYDSKKFLQQNEREFKERVKVVDHECTDSEKLQILRLCNILAKSDGSIDQSEEILLNYLKEGLTLA
jgi:hypothetical protein